MNSGHRYLLYIDLLGFTSLVRERTASEVHQIIKESILLFDEWERLNDSFGTIYFSDTFIFYQKTPGYHDSCFLDVYGIGALILAALLSKGVPARGVISYGDFSIDSEESHPKIYFGNALIEAHRSEKGLNWIGISILESAWQPYAGRNKSLLEVFESEHVWLRSNSQLLLNPFQKIRIWHMDSEVIKPYSEWDAPYFINDIKGFLFLHQRALSYSTAGQFTSKEAGKYFSTIEFLKKVMGTEMYNWAMLLSREISLSA
jgi:hypothetical protein